jgi:hypothetical protein
MFIVTEFILTVAIMQLKFMTDIATVEKAKPLYEKLILITEDIYS